MLAVWEGIWERGAGGGAGPRILFGGGADDVVGLGIEGP